MEKERIEDNPIENKENNENNENNEEPQSAEEDESENLFEINTLILGDCSVGKTCILLRYVCNSFDEGQQPTIGVDFRTKKIILDKESINFRIWDSAGQERFRSITQQFFKNADGIILVYDVTQTETYTQINNWIEDIQKNKLPRTKVFLVGNKIDDEEKRVIQKEKAEAFSKEQGFDYFETSAKVGTGIEEMFTKVAEELCKIKKEYNGTEEEEHSLKLDSGHKQAKKKCKKGCC